MTIIEADIVHTLTIYVTSLADTLVPTTGSALGRIEREEFCWLREGQMTYTNVVRSGKVVDNSSAIGNTGMSCK